MQPLFFIAIVPQSDIQEDINRFKHHFANDFGSVAALKSPPHITLVSPFRVTVDKMDELKEWFTQLNFKINPVEIELNGFGAFFNKHPVVFVKPILTPELEDLYQYCRVVARDFVPLSDSERPFHPHMTIGFKDLSSQQFEKAWNIYKDKSYNATFSSREISLLQHSGTKWEIVAVKRFQL